MAKDLAQARYYFDDLAKQLQLDGGSDLRLRWENLLQQPLFRSTLAQYPRLSDENPLNFKGMDEDLLPVFIHGLLIEKTLSKNTFASLFPGNAIVQADFQAFFALLSLRVMAERPAPLSKEDLLTIGSLVDRLFFGAERFRDTARVPEVRPDDYVQLRKIRVPSMVGQVVSSLSVVHHHLMQPELRDLRQLQFRSGQLLLAASARRNGRKVATAEDACNAIEALMALFHDDVLSLPLVERFSPTA